MSEHDEDIDQMAAAEMTVAVMVEKMAKGSYPKMPFSGDTGVNHLLDMLVQMRTWGNSEPPAHPCKLGRYLGWMQASLERGGVLTLDDCKDINRSCSWK